MSKETEATHTPHAASDHGQDVQAVMEVHAQPHGDDHAFNPVQVDTPMVVWTWITFALLAWVLHKFAWKPILAGLDKRESHIKESIDKADEITRRLEEIKNEQDALIAKADQKAKDIVEQSRSAAREAARSIENKAKEDAQILVETARREINTARDKAQATLRQESAELAVALAGKILQEKLDADKQKALTNRLLEEL